MYEKFEIAGYPALALLGEAREPEGCYSISFTGDFGFWNNCPTPSDWERHYETELPLLSKFDLRIINLEFVLPGSQGRDLECESASLDYLKKSAMDVVSLANNHAMAFGQEGLNHNLGKMDEAGLGVIGLKGNSLFVTEGGGLRIGVFSLTDLLDDPDADGRILRSRPDDLESVRRQAEDVDFLIAFPHLGSRSIYPGPHEMNKARSILKSSVDLLVCTGSHFPKGCVEVLGKPVCFGLGNHLFTWDGGNTESVGMHFVACFSGGKLVQCYVVPFNNSIMRGSTGPLTDQQIDDFRRTLIERSTTDTSRFWNDPRTQNGALDRIKNFRAADFKKVRLWHLAYGVRALISKLMKR